MIKQTITPQTIISPGTVLSKNFILAHTSSGAYHYLLGKIVPQFTAFLKPGSSSIPTWQVAANLQMGAQGILDNLLNGFGNDLIIRSGFQKAIGQLNLKESMGQSFDIQINGFESNMYGVAKEIQKLASKASDLKLIYDNTSFMRINFDQKSILNSSSTNFVPKLSTEDVLNNVFEKGLTSIRGL